jgi:hypothetical protein
VIGIDRSQAAVNGKCGVSCGMLYGYVSLFIPAEALWFTQNTAAASRVYSEITDAMKAHAAYGKKVIIHCQANGLIAK